MRLSSQIVRTGYVSTKLAAPRIPLHKGRKQGPQDIFVVVLGSLNKAQGEHPLEDCTHSQGWGADPALESRGSQVWAGGTRLRSRLTFAPGRVLSMGHCIFRAKGPNNTKRLKMLHTNTGRGEAFFFVAPLEPCGP